LSIFSNTSGSVFVSLLISMVIGLSILTSRKFSIATVNHRNILKFQGYQYFTVFL
jgi:hypothetical protein